MDPEILPALLRRAEAERAVDALTDDERLQLFAGYCQGCGIKDPSCQCWNDE